jgi:DNA-binding response OmpR family regulator
MVRRTAGVGGLIQPSPRDAMPGAAILLVEDDSDIAAMFGLGLRCAGHDVVWAADGGSAFGLASRQGFDLVLLDVHLPRVDGLEALAAFRSHPATRDLRVVMFTNSQDEAIRLHAHSLGITDWIVKSRIRPGELASRVGPWLARAAARDRLAPLETPQPASINPGGDWQK